jgi:hypothetical protein
MPSENSDVYKEMYEMGQRLIEMAKEGGYDPESSSDSSDSMGYNTDSNTGAPTDKVGTAMSFLGK